MSEIGSFPNLFSNSLVSLRFGPSAPPLIEMKAYWLSLSLRILKYARNGEATCPTQTGPTKRTRSLSVTLSIIGFTDGVRLKNISSQIAPLVRGLDSVILICFAANSLAILLAKASLFHVSE
jgi:hypothetical protein